MIGYSFFFLLVLLITILRMGLESSIRNRTLEQAFWMESSKDLSARELVFVA